MSIKTSTRTFGSFPTNKKRRKKNKLFQRTHCVLGSVSSLFVHLSLRLNEAFQAAQRGKPSAVHKLMAQTIHRPPITQTERKTKKKWILYPSGRQAKEKETGRKVPPPPGRSHAITATMVIKPCHNLGFRANYHQWAPVGTSGYRWGTSGYRCWVKMGPYFPSWCLRSEIRAMEHRKEKKKKKEEK